MSRVVSEIIDSPYVEHFEQVQSRPFWQLLLTEFAKFSTISNPVNVLDVGCGPGMLVKIFADQGCQATGVDMVEGMIDRAIANNMNLTGTSFVVADGCAMEFEDQLFDMVCATNMVFYQRDPLSVLLEMSRVCKIGGTVAMFNPSASLSLDCVDTIVHNLALEDECATALTHWAKLGIVNDTFDADTAHALMMCAGITDLVYEELPLVGIGAAIRGKRCEKLPSGL